MKRGVPLLMLLLVVLSIGVPTSAFAEGMSGKTEVGISFTEADNVPNANQILSLNGPRGQPSEKTYLPKTNESTDSILVWEGSLLLLMVGVFSINKKKKKEK
ncbi:LPXTG cell wall anchor domain-containing protein [Enterococcus faecalis]|nr:LPXTG cell wall anchor domain-containing protein [Enterococcus faecalis]